MCSVPPLIYWNLPYITPAFNQTLPHIIYYICMFTLLPFHPPSHSTFYSLCPHTVLYPLIFIHAGPCVTAPATPLLAITQALSHAFLLHLLSLPLRLSFPTFNLHCLMLHQMTPTHSHVAHPSAYSLILALIPTSFTLLPLLHFYFPKGCPHIT